MLKKSTSILFSLLLFIGCGKNAERRDYFKEYNITSRSYDTELYGKFPYLLTVDTLLISIASEGLGGRIGRIYSTGDKLQEIGAFGRIGRGPREFVQVEPTATAGSRFLLRNCNCFEVAMMEVVKTNDSIHVEEIDRMKYKRYSMTILIGNPHVLHWSGRIGSSRSLMEAREPSFHSTMQK